MTNKEKYQRAFSALHASGQFREVETMKATSRYRLPRVAVICAAIILIVGLASVAYAADLGGIQRIIQIWIEGDRTDAVLTIENGAYELSYEGADGQTHYLGGAGVVADQWGNERPMTDEEIWEYLNAPWVEYRDDGTAWVYFRNQKLEITDEFDEDGLCYVQLKDGKDTMYLVAEYQGAYSYDPHRYPDAASWGMGN